MRLVLLVLLGLALSRCADEMVVVDKACGYHEPIRCDYYVVYRDGLYRLVKEGR